MGKYDIYVHIYYRKEAEEVKTCGWLKQRIFFSKTNTELHTFKYFLFYSEKRVFPFTFSSQVFGKVTNEKIRKSTIIKTDRWNNTSVPLS